MSAARRLRFGVFGRGALAFAVLFALLTCAPVVAEEAADEEAAQQAVAEAGEETAVADDEAAEDEENTEAEESAEVEEEPLEYSRIVNIPGLGEMMYYAQNDPLWAKVVYEAKNSPNRSPMRSGACGPTSLAMAIARQVPDEALNALLSEAKDQEKGFRFCECSILRDYHIGDHEFINPRTTEDFVKYLPVIFASYATGNNIHYRQYRYPGSGTNNSVFRTLAQFYGLTYRSTQNWEEAREALEDGYSVITTVTKGIFTSSSHYLYVAGIADGYVYILDSLMRTEYPNDRNHRLEIVEPGVVRAPVDEVAGLQLYGFYMMKAE